MVNRLDRSTSVPIADRSRPMIRSPSQCPGTARSCTSAGIGDHHFRADMRPRLGLRPGSWHAQRSPGAQTGHQLTLERTTSLNVQSLINGLVRDAHGLVIRELNLQPTGNLFRGPALDPLAVTAVWRVSTYERCLPWSGKLTAISITNL